MKVSMRIRLTCSLLLLLLTTTVRADLGNLEYITEDYPPYNFNDEQGKPTGLAVELLQLMWKNSKVAPQPIQLIPWARGYYLLTRKTNVVLFSTARTQARDHLFKWVCPIGKSEYILLGRKEQQITLNTLDEINRYKISTVRLDAARHQLFHNGIDDNSSANIIPANRLTQGVKMLVAGRVDLLATSKLAGYSAIHQLNLNPDDFNIAMTLHAEQLCFAFNPHVEQSDFDQFKQAMARTLASREFRKLQAKYLSQY